MVHTIRQFELVPVAAFRTGLTSVSRVDLNCLTPGPCCLEVKKVKEMPPCYIANAFVDIAEIIFSHVVDRQIFNGNYIKSVHKFAGFLVNKVVAFPLNSFMYTSNYLTGFCPGFGPFLLGSKFTLGFGKSFLLLPEKTRVFNLLAIGEGCKRVKTHINTNSRFNRFLGWFMFDHTRERNKPFPSKCTPDSTSLDYPLNRSVKFNLDTAYFRQPDNILEKLKARLRICERIVTALTTKTRITRGFTRFHPAKKCPESKINPNRNFLKTLAINVTKKFILLFKPWDRINLGITRNRFFISFPSRFKCFFHSVYTVQTIVLKDKMF